MKKRIYTLTLLAACLLFNTVDGLAAIYHVKTTGSDANNGTSWGTAFQTLQKALEVAVSGDDIWVAAGTYYAHPNSQFFSFELLENGVRIYGGFSGSETSITQRNWQSNVCILSGDIDQDGTPNGNSYRVIFAKDLDNTVVLDGFTITGGNSQGNPIGGGGGLYNTNSSPTVENCIFTNNNEGMYNTLSSSPKVTSCIFTNTSERGMYNSFDSNPIVVACIFYQNEYGLENHDFCFPKLNNCIFSENNRGVHNRFNSFPSIVNCRFTDNTYGLYNSSSIPTVFNCSFTKNTNGIYNGSSDTWVTNCILWGNGTEISEFPGSSNPVVRYSIVQGGYVGIGNIDADPLFVDAANNNLRLIACSPAVDAGTNTGAPPVDIDGLPRPVNINGTATVDMGAYELQSASASAPDAKCKNAIVQLDEYGEGAISVSALNNNSTGCGLTFQVAGQTTLYYDCGSLNSIFFVTVTVTDIYGATDICNSSISVRDDIKPTVTCQSATINLSPTSSGGIVSGATASVTEADVVTSKSDNCGNVSISFSPSIFYCNSFGPQTVTATANDGNGNTATCTATVTVEDITPPVAICKNATVTLNASGSAFVSNSAVNDGSNDNCSLTTSLSKSIFGCGDIGPNSVTLTATDPAGNSHFCLATVTVVGNTTPTANCQPHTVQLDGSGNGSLTAADIDNGSYASCGSVTLSASPNTFTCADLGTKTVTLTVTDNNSNTNTCNATVTVTPFAAGILYVDQNATGDNNGSSWANAFTDLQDALSSCAVFTEIWVATGTYKPTAGTDRTISFVMLPGVAIYGGFAGGEMNLSDRDWMDNVTTLSGDIGTPGDDSDNSHHVIFNNDNGLDATAVLDGFTISGGNANGGSEKSDGGGMFNSYSSPTVTNCIFTNNVAESQGGGVHNINSSPVITNSIFANNTADEGGGMINYLSSSSVVTNCTFTDNSVTFEGGGMMNRSATPIVTNCIFTANTADVKGGGIANVFSSASVTNCTFSGNTSTNGGGAYNFSTFASSHYVNCSFSGNSASSEGGGVYNYDASPTVNNCIVWDNGTEIVNFSSTPTVTHSIVQGGYDPCTDCPGGDGDVDPQFISSTDFHLQQCSPAIDAGDNAANGTSEDLDGNDRKVAATGNGEIIDLGAYEYQGNYSVCTACLTSGNIVYVNDDATGDDTGKDWGNAFLHLQDALDVAGSCPEVTQIWVAAGAYLPTQETGGTGDRFKTFVMLSGVAIYGGFAGGEMNLSDRNWMANVTTLSGDIGTPGDDSDNCYHVIFNDNFITLDGSAVLDGFTITGGKADGSGPLSTGAGMFNRFTSPAVTNCVFSGNEALEEGGGMFNNSSSPALSNCTFIENSASRGGGLFNLFNDSNPTITGCSFIGNSAEDDGGGMYNNNGASLAVIDCIFSDNSASNGAGIYNNVFSSPSLTNCTFSGNSASDDGGGIYNSSGASPTVIDCIFSDNSANTGGGIYNSIVTSPSLTNCTFSDNEAINGGGMLNFSSFPTVENCVFSENTAENGAGIQNQNSSTPSIVNCAFNGNKAEDDGGGIDNLNSTPTITNCTFSDNEARIGGGMNNTLSSSIVTNCVFAGNTASFIGGGMHSIYTSSPSLTNCTFSENTAVVGGGLANTDCSPAVANCIFWANGSEFENTGSEPSVTHCIIQGGYPDGTDIIDQDPLFVDAANGDLHLQACSPAINAGDNAAIPSGITTDLDGNDRIYNSGTVDMGAYELQVFQPTPDAQCQDQTVQLDAAGNGSIAVSELGNGSTGCGIQVEVGGQTSLTFDCDDVGSNGMTLRVTDASGNTSSCPVTVTVEDNVSPEAKCKVHTVALDANGEAIITTSDIDNFSSDACGIASLALDNTSIDCSDVPSTNVTLTVTDVNGKVNTCTATVTVEDNVLPTANCKAYTVQLDANGNGSLMANDIDDNSSDACGIQSHSASPNSFTCADVGAKTVTLTVIDNNGNENTCNATVTVEDSILPMANCKAHTVQLNSSGSGILTADDIDDNSSDACGIQSHSASPNTFTCADVGAKTVTLTVTDLNGNVDMCDADVTVVDNIDPIATCKPYTVQLDANGDGSLIANDIDDGSSDACGIQHISAAPTAFVCANVGTNTVTLTVTDVNGNEETCDAEVTVEDNLPPTVTCQPATYTLGASGVHTIDPADLFAGGSDNCVTVTPISTSPASLTCGDLGPNPVSLTVEDGSGNEVTCQTSVTILAGPYFTWYKDTDGDGYSSGDVIEGCEAPGNYVLAAGLTVLDGDCNDSNPFVHPDRFEQCNGIDDDCDGMTDENAVTGISMANISACEDGLFTADVTVTFDDIAPNGNLSLSGDGSASVPVGALSGSSHTFYGVEMAADGGPISLSAQFSAAGCALANTNAGTAPANCAGCEIDALWVHNGGGCDPNGNTDPSDDTFTADVAVYFSNPPASGTLDLTGDGTASVTVSALGGTSYTFTGVVFASDGGPISLSAGFSDGDCDLDVANAGTAFGPCCFVEITGVETTPESCTGFANGSVEISAEGTGTLRYSIDGGATWQLSNTFANLSPGGYPVVVQVVGGGCSASSAANVPTGTTAAFWYKDIDGDGYTDGLMLQSCAQPTGYVATALPGDCNDYDADEFPGQVWYADLDGDGYTDGTTVTSCSQPTGHVISALPGDCDDTDPNVNPGAVETCNGIDDNCDGNIDEGTSGGLTWVGNVNFTNQAQVDAFSQCYSVIDGNLTIQNSGINDLSNLINLVEVTGNVYIKSTGLDGLGGLDSLTEIGGHLEIRQNNSLTTLDGLDSLSSVGGHLRVFYNRDLVDCCAVHDLLGTPGAIGGSVTIFRNDTGCDSVAEIEDECGGGSNLLACPDCGAFPEQFDGWGLSVYPNPVRGTLNVNLERDFDRGHFYLYDLQGRLVLQGSLATGQRQFQLNLSGRRSGTYLLRTETDDRWRDRRVVVEK